MLTSTTAVMVNDSKVVS